MMTKTEIVKLLESNDKAIARALVVLYNNQTKDEQRSETTKYNNGIGFRGCHAKIGTSMAEFYQKRGFLSPKQIAYWRVKDKNGDMRLAIYWRQLAEAAEAKKARISAQTTAQNMTIPTPAPVAQVCPDELEMQRMEVEHDRAQTRNEELLKALRKGFIER